MKKAILIAGQTANLGRGKYIKFYFISVIKWKRAWTLIFFLDMIKRLINMVNYLTVYGIVYVDTILFLSW